jgi:phage-related baseplate assembly protein
MPLIASRRFAPFDPRYFGVMSVLEALDSETTLASRMARLKARWLLEDPPMAAAYDVEGLEFDPIKVNQEVNTFFELTLRDRVNQAARAVTLAFAVGNDLDAIGSRYPGGVARLPIVADPRPYITSPVDWESDDRYRARLWLSASAFSTAGSGPAYVFWAMTAVPTLRDATAIVDRPVPTADPTVIVTCLADDILVTGAYATMVAAPTPANVSAYFTALFAWAPIPSDTDLVTVHRKLHQTDIKPLTDVVAIRSPNIVDTNIELDLWFYPGADSGSSLALATPNVATLLESNRYLGMDLTQSALDAAAMVNGVQNVKVRQPVADIVISERQVIRIGSVTLNPRGFTE